MAGAELAVVADDAPAHQPALLEIDSWTAVASQVIRLAKEIADTPFVPDGLRGSVPATAAAILAGRELGLGPMTSLANIHVIKGKPALSAALMRALILAQGHQIETVDITDTRAVVRGRRKGEAVWEDASFTADQAKRAHIDLGGYPQDKLYARATSRLARRKFADVIAGMPYSAEELEDGEAPEDAPAPAANGQEPPKPAARTARRRTAAAGDAARSQRGGSQAGPHRADEHGAGTAPAAAGGAPSRAEQHLPPLPGEDEKPPADAVPDGEPASGPAAAAGTDPGEPGDKRHRALVGIVWQHLGRLGYPGDKQEDDEQCAARLADVATLAGVSEIGSTSDLDTGELAQVADTLSRCKNRKALDALLEAARKGGSGD